MFVDDAISLGQYLILQWMSFVLTNGQSFSIAWETYQRLCPPVSRNCRNNVMYNDTEQPLPINNCCGFCECDSTCYKRGSCCIANYPSFQQVNISTDSSRFRCVAPQFLKSQEETHYLNGNDVEKVWMITRCDTNQTDYKSDIVRSFCEDPKFATNLETIVPVSDTVFNYKNRYCAYCNGVRTLSFNWKFNLFCSDEVSVTDENLLATIREKKCNIFYIKPHTSYYKKCVLPIFSISQCNETGLWPKFDHNIALACSTFTDPFNLTYKNYFCYLCNTDKPVPPESLHCKNFREELPILNPPYRFSYDLDVIIKKKNQKMLGCDINIQFPDLKKMKCRAISCHKDRYFDNRWKECISKTNIGQDYCFSLFIKLTLPQGYILRAELLKQTFYLKLIKYYVTNFLSTDTDVVTEIKLYPKLRGSSKRSYIEYLVVQLILDVGEAANRRMLSLFVKHLNRKQIKSNSEGEYIIFHSTLAAYNITIDESGKSMIFVPRYNSLDVDILKEYDLSGSDVYNEFVGIQSGNACLIKEIKPLKKIDIVPFIEVGMDEFAITFENSFLTMREEYLEKTFSSWEYELHDKLIYMCLEDYDFIYHVMPKDRLYNAESMATLAPIFHSRSIIFVSVSFIHLILNIVS